MLDACLMHPRNTGKNTKQLALLSPLRGVCRHNPRSKYATSKVKLDRKLDNVHTCME